MSAPAGGVNEKFRGSICAFGSMSLNANTDERTYRTMGRFYWARLGIKF